MRNILGLLARVWSNWLSLTGAVITSMAAIGILVGLVIHFVTHDSNPYAVFFFLLGMPALFAFGLTLIPIGFWLERRRKPEDRETEESLLASFREMMHRPRVRRRVLLVLVASIANIMLLTGAGSMGASYMATPTFCGSTCHAMDPQYGAYKQSAHSQVACVDCHIGSGVSHEIKAKLNGLHQVWSVVTDTVPTPIVGPVEGLRPAVDTCEKCHNRAKFFGTKVRFFAKYDTDEKNSAEVDVVALRLGGKNPKNGKFEGIHSHMDPSLRIEYDVMDKKRTIVGSIRVFRDGEQVAEYKKPSDKSVVNVRTMDCIDCHNRPTHVFDQDPDWAIDNAFLAGTLDASVPWIKAACATVLKADPPARADAESTFLAGLGAFYDQEHADKKPSDKILQSAAKTIAAIYLKNVYPKMKVTFGTYPTHIGHRGRGKNKRLYGCFRCHDEKHKTDDGKELSQDCDLCHEALIEEEPMDELPDTVKALMFKDAAAAEAADD